MPRSSDSSSSARAEARQHRLGRGVGRASTGLASRGRRPARTSGAEVLRSLPFLIALIVCFSVTWMISCASTPASSASFLISASAPRVMCTNPPGAANAFTPSVSSTMNCHVRFGRALRLRPAPRRPATRTVDGLVLHDAVALPDALADQCADLVLLLVGDASVSAICLATCRPSDADQAPELRRRGARRHQRAPRCTQPTRFIVSSSVVLAMRCPTGRAPRRWSTGLALALHDDRPQRTKIIAPPSAGRPWLRR